MTLPSLLKPATRRSLGLAFVLALGFLAGCSKKSALEQAVDTAARRYSSIQSGMTKQQVVTALGEPARREGTLWRWEISANAQSNASLELQFDASDRVTKIIKSHARRD